MDFSLFKMTKDSLNAVGRPEQDFPTMLMTMQSHSQSHQRAESAEDWHAPHFNSELSGSALN
jgi:hypothetical protein